MTGLELTTDVLVVGGGPAATWAALKAAQAGADVVLADKGYCGTSGATASAGTGVWYVPPEPGWGPGRTPGALRAVGPSLGRRGPRDPPHPSPPDDRPPDHLLAGRLPTG